MGFTRPANIYEDPENVKSRMIQSSLGSSIYHLSMDRFHSEISDDHLRKMIAGTSPDLLCDKTKSILLDHMSYDTKLDRCDVTFALTLKFVIQRIETKSKNDKIRRELYQRLREEMAEPGSTCFVGAITRLVNVLSGFFDDIQIGISDSEQILMILTSIRRRHHLSSEEWDFPPAAIEEFRAELTDRGYEACVIEGWMSAFQ